MIKQIDWRIRITSQFHCIPICLLSIPILFNPEISSNPIFADSFYASQVYALSSGYVDCIIYYLFLVILFLFLFLFLFIYFAYFTYYNFKTFHLNNYFFIFYFKIIIYYLNFLFFLLLFSIIIYFIFFLDNCFNFYKFLNVFLFFS